MTKRFLSVFSAVTLVAMLAPISVRTGAAQVTCRIPFSFAVKGQTLPAGAYSLETRNAVLLISGADHRAIVMGTPMGLTAPTEPKLVFDKYRDQYTLREIWMGGKSGQELTPSRRDLDRSKSAGNGQLERVVIAAQ